MQLLVDAWNRCGLPHDPGASPLTLPAFKREIRELGLWCSSCMVAFDGSDAVGVLIGCKRPPHTLVHRIAVHPDEVRKGHGRHLLTSLSAKLAILGPKILLAEVPADRAPAIGLLEACGWKQETRAFDLSFTGGTTTPAGTVHDATPAELGDSVMPSAERSWARTPATLTARAERLKALVSSSTDRVDAALLYTDEDPAGASVWAVTYERDAAGETALRSLLGELRRRFHDVRLPRVGSDEIDLDRLDALGLSRSSETICFTSEARPA
jgi:GNAT superfamily N-acetyltransferase